MFEVRFMGEIQKARLGELASHYWIAINQAYFEQSE
jgi:hypothetical protein